MARMAAAEFPRVELIRFGHLVHVRLVYRPRRLFFFDDGNNDDEDRLVRATIPLHSASFGMAHSLGHYMGERSTNNGPLLACAKS